MKRAYADSKTDRKTDIIYVIHCRYYSVPIYMSNTEVYFKTIVFSFLNDKVVHRNEHYPVYLMNYLTHFDQSEVPQGLRT